MAVDSMYFELACKDGKMVKTVRKLVQCENPDLNVQSDLFKALFKFEMLTKYEQKMVAV